MTVDKLQDIFKIFPDSLRTLKCVVCEMGLPESVCELSEERLLIECGPLMAEAFHPGSAIVWPYQN